MWTKPRVVGVAVMDATEPLMRQIATSVEKISNMNNKQQKVQIYNTNIAMC